MSKVVKSQRRTRTWAHCTAIACLLSFISWRGSAQSVSLAWDPSTATNLTSYRIKYGTTSGSYTGQVDVATNRTTLVISNLTQNATYYFVVAARNAQNQESDPSNEVNAFIPRAGTNHAPVALAASITTAEDAAKALTLAGSDADGDPLTYTIVGQPTHGTLSGTPPAVTYTPAPNYFGSDSFTFRVSDGITNSAAAAISITVTGVNDPPTLNPIASLNLATNAGLQTVSLLGIGPGAANEIQTLVVTASSSNPSVVPTPTVNYSSPNTSGNLTFTPVAGVNGTATITVVVNDGQAQNNTTSRSFLVTVGTSPTVTLFVQAESGTLTAPMAVVADATASNGSFVQSPTANSGNVSFAVNIPQADDYTVWCRVLSPDNSRDSFFFALDGGAQSEYDTTSSWSPSWQWSRLPWVLTLSQATHSLIFATRESYTGLDALYVTSDPNFVPGTSTTNAPPTIDAISNLTLAEDAPQQTVNLSNITDGSANETQTLTVTATSSNTGLIPNPTVNYTSPNSTGTLTFTPVPNASGTASITVTVNDGQSQNGTVSRTFNVTVTAVNDPPTLDALSNLSLAEDAGLQTVSLTGIGSGAANEAQTLTVTASSSNTGLIPTPTVSYTSPNSTGSLSFTPVANANGTATITVTVNDGQSANNSVTRTFTVTVSSLNDPPTLNAIANVTLNEDAGVQTVNLTGISSGAANESQTLIVTATSSNTGLIPNPTVNYTSPSSTGTLTFTPVPNANGTATITVNVNDGQSQNGTVSRTFNVTVTAVNDPPTLDALSNLSLAEDAGLQTVSLTGIGSGAANEAQTLTVTASSSNTGLIPTPTVSYTSPNSTGSLSFTPVANANGTATITVTVNDGQSANNTVTRTFTVTVSNLNDAPTLNAIANVTINEDAGVQTVNLTGITSGAANESQTLIVTAISSNTGLIPNPTVVYTSPNTTGSLTFAPAANASGTATVLVTVNDGGPVNNTVTRTFSVTVNPINDAPTLDPLGNLTIAEDSPQQTVGLTGIGSGAPDEVQALTVTATSSNPSLIPNPTVNYTSPAATGTLAFQPATNANGTATITVTVNDAQAANNTFSRSFTVTVTGINDLPTISGLADQTINESGTTGALPLTIGDTETSATSLTLTGSSSDSSLVPTSAIVFGGSGANRTVTVTPTAKLNGAAAITVRVADANGGSASQTFNLTVNPVNDPPTLSTIANVSVNEDAGPQTINLTGISTGATNEFQTLTITAVSSDPSLIPNPTVVYTSPSTTGLLNFTPAFNANGTATITVTIDDGQPQNHSVTRSFTVTVNAVNDPPTLASLNNLALSEDFGAQTVSLAGISSGAANENQTLTVTASSSSTSLIPNPTVTYTSPNSSGTLTLRSLSNATGTATITVTVNDGQTQNNTVTRSFTVTVNGVNDPPTISHIADQSISEGNATAAIPFTVGDVETPAANLLVSGTSDNQALVPDARILLGGSGANRTVTVTPMAGLFGTALITLQVADANGGFATDSFTLVVNSINQPPTLDAINNITINEDAGPQTVSLTGITAGATNEAQNLVITASSSNPTLLPNLAVNYTSPNLVGTLTFSPGANLSGSATVSVTVNDGQSQNNTVTRSFVVTVNPQNDPPVISAIANQSIAQNTSTALLPFTVNDVETAAGSLTVAANSSNPTLVPASGLTLGGSGANRTIKVTPAANQFGSAIITLTVSDGTGGLTSGSFVLTVTTVNQPPTLDPLSDLTIVEDAGPQTVALTGISSGAANESQFLVVTAVSSDTSLVPDPVVTYSSPNPTGSLVLNPVTNANGTATITVTVNDGQGQNNLVSRSFQVTVNAVNDAPTMNPISNIVLTQGTAIQTIALTGISSGAANENEDLTITAVSSNPSLIPNPVVTYFTPNTTGSLTVSPNPSANGTATITVTVDDGQSEHNTLVRVFSITVSGQNQPPSINDLPDVSVPVGGIASPLNLTIGDAETPADSLLVVATSSNPALVWTNNIIISGTGSNRVASVVTTPGQSGFSIITFTVYDTDGASASDSFVLTAVPANAPPTLDPIPSLIISEDAAPQTITLTGISSGSPSENQTLIISAISSTPSVIPHPTINYTSPNSTATLTFAPAPNVSGSATIIVTVNDGQARDNITTRTFGILVNPANDAPTITPIANQIVPQNTPTAVLPFIIGDLETPAGSLGLSASSSNPTLVPNSNIVLGGSGANRTVQVTPANLQSGTATISIFVTDGSLTAASAFDVTVGSGNTAPVIAAPVALATDSYTPLTNVQVTVGDKESRPDDLVVTAISYNQTVLPNTNIIFSGSGSNRMVTLKPVAGKSGTVSISFSVSDGSAVGLSTCQLSVQLGTAPKSKLNVRKKGGGTVQPALDGQDLTIGTSYTLTAIPGTNELFTGWSGGITSTTPTITFVMKKDFELVCGFTNNPYPRLKGSYNGLFHEVAEVRQQSSGSFTLTPTDKGSFSGKLKLGALSYAFSGKVDLSCRATNILVRKGSTPLIVELDFGRAPTNQVVGRVTDGIWEAPLVGDRAIYNSKLNPAPFAGSYTLMLPGQDDPAAGPQGDGAATIKIDGNGLATLVGTLADGTKVSQKVPVAGAGQWPLYLPLYSGSGSVLSWMILANRSGDDMNGLLSWIKPASLKSKYYAAGFTNETVAVGSRYVTPVLPTLKALALTDGQVTFAGGNLSTPFVNSFHYDDNGKITGTGPTKLSLAINKANGLMSGSVQDPSTGKLFKFSGAVFQKQNTGSGFLLGTNQSARVVVTD